MIAKQRARAYTHPIRKVTVGEIFSWPRAAEEPVGDVVRSRLRTPAEQRNELWFTCLPHICSLRVVPSQLRIIPSATDALIIVQRCPAQASNDRSDSGGYRAEVLIVERVRRVRKLVIIGVTKIGGVGHLDGWRADLPELNVIATGRSHLPRGRSGRLVPRAPAGRAVRGS